MNYQVWNGSAAIVIQENKVLMIRAKNKNSWGVPSGGIEVGETPQQACLRELWEETGFKGRITKELHTKEAIIDTYQVTTHYFLCEVIGGEISYHDPDEEIEEVGWKSINELAFIEHVYPEDVQLLEQLLIKSEEEIKCDCSIGNIEN